MHTLGRQGHLTPEELSLVRLRLFDLCELRGDAGLEDGIPEDEFVNAILSTLLGDGVDLVSLWRSTTSCRLELRLVQDELLALRSGAVGSGRRRDSKVDEAAQLRQELEVTRNSLKSAQNA